MQAHQHEQIAQLRQRIYEKHDEYDHLLLQENQLVPPPPIKCSFKAVGMPCHTIQGEVFYYKCPCCRFMVCHHHLMQLEFRKFLCQQPPVGQYVKFRECAKCKELYLQGSKHQCSNSLEEFIF